MSKIARYQGNLRAFASGAQGLERTVFGETTQADDLTSQVTSAFLRGWGVVGPSEHPSLEDFNAAMYAMSQFIAYQHQMGVPEWHSEQEYFIGSMCLHDGETYQSLIDSNIGNEPPSSHWTKVINSENGPSELGLGTAAKKNVGTGPGQIPDMSSFSVGVGNSYFRFPNGMIIQIFGVTPSTSLADTPFNFPLQFPNSATVVIGCYNGGLNANFYSFNSITKNGGNMRAFTGGSSTPTTGGGTAAVLAVGY